MKYIYLSNNVVIEIIPEEDPIFPGIPITDRYSPDFLSKCVAVDENVVVNANDIYDPVTQTFSTPAPVDPPDPEPEQPTVPIPTIEERVSTLETAMMGMMLGL